MASAVPGGSVARPGADRRPTQCLRSATACCRPHTRGDGPGDLPVGNHARDLLRGLGGGRDLGAAASPARGLAQQPRRPVVLPAGGRAARRGSDRRRAQPTQPSARAEHQLRPRRGRGLADDDRGQLRHRGHRHLGRRRPLADPPVPRGLHPRASRAPRRGPARGDARRRLHQPRSAGARSAPSSCSPSSTT